MIHFSQRLLPAAVTLGVVAACAAAPAASPAKDAAAHVVVITIDGLRGDAIAAAGASALLQLERDGATTLKARAVAPPETLPSHVTMATGLTPEAHGIKTNQELEHDIDRPTIFTAAHKAGLRTALYYGKAKLVALAPGHSADVMRGPGPGESDWKAGAMGALAQDFADDFPREKFALAWIHLRDPDLVGHKKDWMSPEYLAAVRDADAAVGIVLKAIDDSGLRASTTVIVSSDHGGEGKEHWGKHDADWIIPWLCRGPSAKAGSMLGAVTTVDVAPTVLALLHLPPLPGMQGHAVENCAP